MTKLRVLIVGAGIAGNAQAFWLAKLGHNVKVVERHGTLRTNGLQIDLRGHGIPVMQRMGLEKIVRAKCVPEEGIAIVDKRGRRQAFFPANTSGKGAQSGSSEYEIMRRDLCSILYDVATEHGATFVFGTTIESFIEHDSPQGAGVVEVTFSNGTKESFDLVIGCDGQSSRVRRLMLGGGSTDGVRDDVLTTLNERMAYYTIQRPLAANEGKGDKFVATVLLVPEKRFALTRRANADELQVYMRCEAPLGPMADVKRGDVAAEKKAFAKMFEGAGWQTDDFVKELREGADDFYCQYSSLVRMESWSRGHVTLVGDAGYCCPPNGLGTSAALIGAYVLAGEIEKHCGSTLGAQTSTTTDNDKRDKGLLAAVQSYEKIFKPYMEDIQGRHSTEPNLFEKIPWNPFTIYVSHRIASVVSTLRIDRLAARLASPESVKGWKLPDYKALM